jgi:hypothetical protein
MGPHCWQEPYRKKHYKLYRVIVNYSTAPDYVLGKELE